MSFIDDLNELDFEDPGGWPAGVKAFAAVAVFILILVGGYLAKVKNDIEILESKQREEQELFTTFEQKQQKAAKLDEYREQLKEMDQILDSMLRQLPSKTEIPNLLQDISQTAIATGIGIDRFRPEAEIIKDFYAEKPISIRMVGSYHQFGEFVSAVSALSRVVILTMHDISLQPIQAGKPDLALEGTVRTYRYVDESEQQEEIQ